MMELNEAFAIVDEISEKFYKIIYNEGKEISDEEKKVLNEIYDGVKILITNFPNKEVKGGLLLDREIEARFAENKVCIDYEIFYKLYSKDKDSKEDLAYKMRNLSHPDYQINLGTYNDNKMVYGWVYFDMSDVFFINKDTSAEESKFKYSKNIEQDSNGNTSIGYSLNIDF